MDRPDQELVDRATLYCCFAYTILKEGPLNVGSRFCCLLCDNCRLPCRGGDKESPMPIDIEYLRRAETLSHLKPRQLDQLAGAFSIKHYSKDRKIFDQNERADQVYLLLAGAVKLSRTSSKRKHVTVSFVPPGSLFGTSPLLYNQRHHQFRARAMSDCTVAALAPEVLVEILTGLPLEEYQNTATVILQVQRHLFLNYVDRIGLTLLKRLISEILDLAEQFGTPDPRGTALEIRVTHADLADCIGASRQRVTQYLRLLERRRALAKRGRTLICDIPRLRRLIESSTSHE